MRLDLLVNHFVYAAVTDGYLVMFEKHFRRNFVHIRDVADCFVHCIAHASAMAGRCYNVGLDSANLSKEELALRIKAQATAFYIHFAPVGSDPDKRDYVVSNERLRQAGFEARRSIDDGIRELIKGYRLMRHTAYGNA
jgi:nucleoside-diphosphate-sugar epimerase